MLILKGKVSNISDKNFTLKATVKDTPLELQSYCYHIDNITEGGIYVLVGDIYIDNNVRKFTVDTVFTSVVDDKTDYAISYVTGYIKYFGKNATSFIGKNGYAKYQIESKVGKNVIYYTCSTKMTEPQIKLFTNLKPDEVVTVQGNFSTEDYQGKPQFNILTKSFNVLYQKDGEKKTSKSTDSDLEFFDAPTEKAIPLDNDF